MLLSDTEIHEAVLSGHLIVDPFVFENIQPASIDLRLHSELLVPPSAPVRGLILNPEELNVSDHLLRYSDRVDISGIRGWILEPGQLVIGQTLEFIDLPNDLAGRVEGRSRLARLGIGVHITAPKIDPGFRNQITLEIFNSGPWTVELSGGMTICALLIERLGRPAEEGYHGVFQGSAGASGQDAGTAR